MDSVVQVNPGGQLLLIDLSNVVAAAQGTNISVSSKLAGHGDGFADVGEIDASGVDLGAVSIRGDLGKLLAGDATAATRRRRHPASRASARNNQRRRNR